MPISVHFRGPMLFVTRDDSCADDKDDRIDAVIIPDATRAGKHADGSPACAHSARLLVTQGSGAPRYIDLAGAEVSITDGDEGGPPSVDDKFLKVPPLHRMINPQSKPHAAARRRSTRRDGEVQITLKGGQMTGTMVDDRGLELPFHLDAAPKEMPVCAMPIWKSDKDKGEITIDVAGVRTTVPLDAETDVFVFNWDTFQPARDEFFTRPNDPRAFQDNDFKWVYTLIEPGDSPDWKTWLLVDSYFPAPRTVGFLSAASRIPGQCVADLSVNGQSSADRPGVRDVPMFGESSPVSTCDPSRIRGIDLGVD